MGWWYSYKLLVQSSFPTELNGVYSAFGLCTAHFQLSSTQLVPIPFLFNVKRSIPPYSSKTEYCGIDLRRSIPAYSGLIWWVSQENIFGWDFRVSTGSIPDLFRSWVENLQFLDIGFQQLFLATLSAGWDFQVYSRSRPGLFRVYSATELRIWNSWTSASSHLCRHQFDKLYPQLSWHWNLWKRNLFQPKLTESNSVANELSWKWALLEMSSLYIS